MQKWKILHKKISFKKFIYYNRKYFIYIKKAFYKIK